MHVHDILHANDTLTIQELPQLAEHLLALRLALPPHRAVAGGTPAKDAAAPMAAAGLVRPHGPVVVVFVVFVDDIVVLLRAISVTATIVCVCVGR